MPRHLYGRPVCHRLPKQCFSRGGGEREKGGNAKNIILFHQGRNPPYFTVIVQTLHTVKERTPARNFASKNINSHINFSGKVWRPFTFSYYLFTWGRKWIVPGILRYSIEPGKHGACCVIKNTRMHIDISGNLCSKQYSN